MTKVIDLKELEKKAYRDAQQDGLADLMIGIGMLCVAGIVLTPSVLKALWYIPILALGRIVEAIRSRVTYPRIGQVKLHSENPKEVVRGIIIFMLCLLTVMFVVFFLLGDVRNFDLWLKWFPAFCGTLLIGLFLGMAGKSGSRRYIIFAFLSVISGFSFALIQFEEIMAGTGMYFLSMGIILIMTGLSLFLWFIHTVPEPMEAMNDGTQ